MLKSDPNQGLLKDIPSSPKRQSTSIKENQNTSQIENDDKNLTKSRAPKQKSQRSQLTYVLKALNFIVGIAFIAFSVYCYYDGSDSSSLSGKEILKYLMPAYIGISGLIILLIECRVGFMIRNMRFVYNYFGRGIFNIYAGAMPLMMINNFNGLGTFQIITLVAASVMCLIGVLYICLKVFCCEKEGDQIDKQKRRKLKAQDDSD